MMMRRFLLVLLFAFCTHLVAQPLKNNDVKSLSIGWNMWYPYQYFDKEKGVIGLDVEITKAVAQAAGFNIEFSKVPWQRHLKLLQSGGIDLSAGASFTKNRSSYVYYSTPYRKEVAALFVKAERFKEINQQVKDLSDFSQSHYKIGVEEGYFYGEYYTSLLQTSAFKAKIHTTLLLETNIEKLMNGTIDAIIADPVTIKAFVKKYHLEGQIEQLPNVVYENDIYFILSKKSQSKEVLNRINKAINRLQKTGAIDSLVNKWGGKNLE